MWGCPRKVKEKIRLILTSRIRLICLILVPKKLSEVRAHRKVRIAHNCVNKKYVRARSGVHAGLQEHLNMTEIENKMKELK